jgi:tRNA-specific adenosine deaminase 1
VPMVERCLRLATYGDVKSSELLQLRRKVKHDARKNALKGWVRNTGSDQFVAEGAEP